MACHVYENKYCDMMTIAFCDMQSEDGKAQEQFGNNLNQVIIENGISNTNFKGFMVAQAN